MIFESLFTECVGPVRHDLVTVPGYGTWWLYLDVMRIPVASVIGGFFDLS